MSQIKIGWFLLEEDWLSSGDIDIAIRDKRTNELVAFQLNNAEDYNKLLDFLDQNRQLGVLTQFKKAEG